MPTELDVQGGGDGHASPGGSDVGGDAGGSSSPAVGDSAGNVGGDNAAAGDQSDTGGDRVGGGDGPARSLGKGDVISQAATKAYRNLTAPEQTAEERAQARNKLGQFRKGLTGQTTGQPLGQRQQQRVDAQGKPIQSQPGQTTGQALDNDRVPDSWRNEAKAKWQAVDPIVRAEINKRELDYRNGHANLNKQIETNKPYVDFAQMLDTTAQPFIQGWQSRGVDLGGMMKDSVTLMGVLHFGSNDQKLEAVRQLVKVFGVNIPRSGGAQTGAAADATQTEVAHVQVPPSPAQLDPAVQQTINQLVQRAQRDDQQRQQDVQRQTQEAQTRINGDVDAFIKLPTSEHFPLVYDKMASLIETGMAKNLQDAYDQAVWSTPAARTAMLNKQRQTEVETANRAAAEARRAAGMRTGGGKPTDFQAAGTQSSGNKRNDTIVSAVRQHMQKFSRAT